MLKNVLEQLHKKCYFKISIVWFVVKSVCNIATAAAINWTFMCQVLCLALSLHYFIQCSQKILWFFHPISQMRKCAWEMWNDLVSITHLEKAKPGFKLKLFYSKCHTNCYFTTFMNFLCFPAILPFQVEFWISINE